MGKIILSCFILLLTATVHAEVSGVKVGSAKTKVLCDLVNANINVPGPFPGSMVTKKLGSTEVETISKESSEYYPLRWKYIDYEINVMQLSNRTHLFRVGGELEDFNISIGNWPGCEAAVPDCSPEVLSSAKFNLQAKGSSAKLSFLDYTVRCTRMN